MQTRLGPLGKNNKPLQNKTKIHIYIFYTVYYLIPKGHHGSTIGIQDIEVSLLITLYMPADWQLQKDFRLVMSLINQNYDFYQRNYIQKSIKPYENSNSLNPLKVWMKGEIRKLS